MTVAGATFRSRGPAATVRVASSAARGWSRRFGCVVSDRTFLGDDGVGAGGQDEVARQTLFLPDYSRLSRDDVAAGDVIAEGKSHCHPRCGRWYRAGKKMPAVMDENRNPP